MSREKSFSLIRTNPVLTGNIKFVLKSNGDFQISPIPVNDTLHDVSFIRPLSSLSSPFEDIPTVFGEVPTNILYQIPQKPDGLIRENYDDIIDQTYLYKVSRCSSMLYDEEFSIFAPLYIKQKFPKYFIIYKSKNGKKTLKDCDIVRIIDLENSPIGAYFKNHMSVSLYNKDHIDIDFIQKHVTYTGISIRKSSIVQISESFDEFVDSSKSVYEFDKWITEGFMRHGLVSHRIFNIEFLFDDDSQDFRYENYFGLYADDYDVMSYNHSEINDDVLSSIHHHFSSVDLCLVKSQDQNYAEDTRRFDINKHSRFVLSDIVDIERHGYKESVSYNEIILDDTRKPVINTSITLFVDGEESETIYSNTLLNLEDGDYGYKQWSTDGWFLTYYNPFGDSSQVLHRISSSLRWILDSLRIYGVDIKIDHENKKLIIENNMNPQIEFVVNSPDGTISLLYDKFYTTKNDFTIKSQDIPKVLGKYVKIGNVYEHIKSVSKRRHSDTFDIITDSKIDVQEDIINIYDEKTFTVSCIDFLHVYDFDYMQETMTKHNDILEEMKQYSAMDMKFDPDLSKFNGYESSYVHEKRPLELIPHACKWVSEYRDIRDDEYRLNVSDEFGNTLTPSFFTTYPNPKFFTHEFFLLSGYPTIIKDYRKMSSYFPHMFDIQKYCFSSYDYFTKYFTRNWYETKDPETGVVSVHYVDTEENWSIVRKNKYGEYTVMHRGVFMTIDSPDDIDGYKFSSILNVDTSVKSNIRLIRNRKFRNIVLICNISYDDYKVRDGNISYLNLYTMGSQSTKTQDGSIVDGSPMDYSLSNSTLKIIIDKSTGDSVRLQDLVNVHYGIKIDLHFVSYTSSSIEIDAIVNGVNRKLKDWYSLNDNGMFMEIVGVETDLESGRKNIVTFRQLRCDNTGVYLHWSNLTIRDFDHNSLYIDSGKKIWEDDSHNAFDVRSGCCVIRYGKPAMESVEILTPKSLFQYVKSIDTKKSKLEWYLIGGGKNVNNYLHEFVNFSRISEFIENNNISYTERGTQDEIKLMFNRPVSVGTSSILRYGGRYNPKFIKLSRSSSHESIMGIIGNCEMPYIDSGYTFSNFVNLSISKNVLSLKTEMLHPEFVYIMGTDTKKMAVDIMKPIDINYDKSSYFNDLSFFMGSLILNLPNSFEITISSWDTDVKDSSFVASRDVVEEFMKIYEKDFINALSDVGYHDDKKTYVKNFCKEKLMTIYKVSSSILKIGDNVIREYDINVNDNIISLKQNIGNDGVNAIVSLSLV